MPLRILVADDSDFWRDTLRTILERDCGCVVFEARDGSEAVQKSNWLQPNMVILDFCMPGLSGLGAARELRARMPKVPVLMVTVDKCLVLEEAARQAGIVAVFSKLEYRELCNFVHGQLHANAA